MFQSNLSTLPEDHGTACKPRPTPVQNKTGPKPIPRLSVTKTWTNSGQSMKKLPPLNRARIYGSNKWSAGRASVSEGFLIPEGSSKTSSEQTTADTLDPRRASFPAGKKTGTMLFAGLGKKVTNMVRARWAFQSDRKSRDQILEANSMEAIHEMPKAPRFSSFMSPETQYAMLMGYEDELHRQLSINHPEYRSVLRRNKTPMFNVGIVKIDLRKRKGMPNSEADDDDDDDDDEKGGGSDTEEKEEERNASAQDGEDDFWISDGRQTSNLTTTTHRSTARQARPPKSRTHTIPFDRRLHLTYRMESAMDILDTIRRLHGQPPISPRVRANKREIAPIRDYNSWTNVWKKEFIPSDGRKQVRKVKV